MPELSFTCAECHKDSGSSLVCRDCIPLLSPYKREKYMRAWHRLVIEAAGCSCIDCGHSAPVESGELTGDHIQTKGARPDLVFDVTNGECRCLGCHNKRHSKGLPQKAEKTAKFKKPPICSEPGCPIYAAGPGSRKPGRCWKHQ